MVEPSALAAEEQSPSNADDDCDLGHEDLSVHGSDSDSSGTASSGETQEATVPPEARQGVGYAYNTRSRIVHVNEDGLRTACGRPLVNHVRFCTEWPEGLRASCTICFKR